MGDEPEGLTTDGSTERDPRGRRAGRFTSLGADLTFALRQLHRHPAFATVAVVTLALGIGVTTAMFSVVHRLLVDPVPFRDADRIVRLYQGMGAAYSGEGSQTVLVAPSIAVSRAWRDRSRTLEQVVWMSGRQYSATLGRGSESEPVEAEAMSADVPSFLGVRPVLGRSFVAGEEVPGAAPTAVLGYGMWRSRFGGARDVIGHTLTLNDTARTIIGVMPPGLALPGENPVEVWIPLVVRDDSEFVTPWARLRRGVSVDAAQRELAGILATTPSPWAHSSQFTYSARVVPLRDYLGPRVERALAFVAGAVGLVLLVACGNVANLLLARAASRRRELSMRTALGASRWRLVRQFAIESCCVTLLAGALGVLIAWRVMTVVGATRPAALDALDAARLDLTALLWTVGVSAVTALVFGMVPLLIGAGRNPADVLKDVSRTTSGGRDAGRLRAALVVGEVALSVTLLAGASVLIRTVRAFEHQDVGFNPHGLTTITVILPTPRFASPERAKPVMDGLAEQLRLIHGVTAVTIAGGAPPFAGMLFGGIDVADNAGAGADSSTSFGFNEVQPDYFEVLGLPIVAGRILDRDTSAHTVMISTEMARHLWPTTSALGKRFRFGPKAPWQIVTGIVHETLAPGAAMRLPDQIYEPLSYGRGGVFVVRSRGASPGLIASATRFAKAIDPRIRVEGKSMDAEFAALFAGRRFTMLLLSVFAGFALVLSAVGLYGVIAFSVVQRTREMGVRMALGASPAAITRLVMADGARLAGAGLAAGAIFTFALLRIARSLVTDVGRPDTASFVAVAVLLSAAAVIAAYVPARRAARVDPAIALRAE
jgi:putative ABC transport system permease protein